MSQSNIQPNERLQKRTGLFWVFMLLCVLAVGMLTYRGLYRGFFSGSDFGLYYSSTVAMVQTGDPYSPKPLRDIAEENGVPTSVIENAIAPPICYTPLLPYAALPWPAARVLWACTNLVGVMLLWYWLMDLARIPRNRLSLEWLAMTFLVAGFAPLQTNIAFGQLAVLATAGIVGSIALAQQGRTRTAAGLYVLAGLLKPQLAIAFALYWVFKREWRVIAYTASIGLVITLLTLGWLQFKNPDWFNAFQSNLQRLTQDGGASDYTRNGAYIFSDLRAPLFAMSQSKMIAGAMAWAITIALGVVAYFRLRGEQANQRPNQLHRPLYDLHLAGLVACLGLLPIYHVYYDSAILLLPAAWAIATLAHTRVWQAMTTLLLFAPMLIPGQPLLNYLERRGTLPTTVSESAVYQWFILPHLPWLTIAIAACMIMYLKPRRRSRSN